SLPLMRSRPLCARPSHRRGQRSRFQAALPRNPGLSDGSGRCLKSRKSETSRSARKIKIGGAQRVEESVQENGRKERLAPLIEIAEKGAEDEKRAEDREVRYALVGRVVKRSEEERGDCDRGER